MDTIMFPTDILKLLLECLALDGAERQFHQLAYLTHKNTELAKYAREADRPLVVRVAIEEHAGFFDRTFFLPLYGLDAIVDWGDGETTKLVSEYKESREHCYKHPGYYTVRVFQDKSDILHHNRPVALGGDVLSGPSRYWWKPLAAIDSLGNIGITSLKKLFFEAGCINADISKLYTGNITDMSYMFYEARAFNQPILRWDVSNVTNMSCMFHGASAFNQPIGGWDVSSVTNMSYMFLAASAFNQPIGGWDVSSVTYVTFMFRGAAAFNQPIGEWDVSNITNVAQMFYGASEFIQSLKQWKRKGRVRGKIGMFGL